jgi:hypothetical protein
MWFNTLIVELSCFRNKQNSSYDFPRAFSEASEISLRLPWLRAQREAGRLQFTLDVGDAIVKFVRSGKKRYPMELALLQLRERPPMTNAFDATRSNWTYSALPAAILFNTTLAGYRL